MKLKLYSAMNENLPEGTNVSHYIFEKDDNFLKWLNKAFSALEISTDHLKAWQVENHVEDKKGRLVKHEFYTKQIKKMVDVHERYDIKPAQGAQKRVDLFYGKNKVYMILKSSVEIKNKFADFLRKNTSWVKESSSKKLPNYLVKETK